MSDEVAPPDPLEEGTCEILGDTPNMSFLEAQRKCEILVKVSIGTGIGLVHVAQGWYRRTRCNIHNQLCPTQKRNNQRRGPR